MYKNIRVKSINYFTHYAGGSDEIDGLANRLTSLACHEVAMICPKS